MKSSIQVVLLLTVLVLEKGLQVSTSIKLASLKCAVHDESAIELLKCRLQAVNRTLTTANVEYQLRKNITKATIAYQFKRKMSGGWHPFLYNRKLDACYFFLHQSRFVLENILYQHIKDYINMNHSCPYQAGEMAIMADFVLDEGEILAKFPVDIGEYGVFTSWYSDGKLVASVNGSAVYSNYKTT